MSLASESFDQLVQEAFDSIPADFQKQMDNLAIFIEEEPDPQTLKNLDVSEGSILLGVYHGHSLTSRASVFAASASLPERITIFQHNIERYCQGDPNRIRDQVRKTLLHEVAHHFGIDHDEMPIWVK